MSLKHLKSGWTKQTIHVLQDARYKMLFNTLEERSEFTDMKRIPNYIVIKCNSWKITDDLTSILKKTIKCKTANSVCGLCMFENEKTKVGEWVKYALSKVISEKNMIIWVHGTFTISKDLTFLLEHYVYILFDI